MPQNSLSFVRCIIYNYISSLQGRDINFPSLHFDSWLPFSYSTTNGRRDIYLKLKHRIDIYIFAFSFEMRKYQGGMGELEHPPRLLPPVGVSGENQV